MSIAEIANQAATAVATYVGTKQATTEVATAQAAATTDTAKKMLYISISIIVFLMIVFFAIKRK
jgi:hypothetical protein